jgi:hypothetical protein
MRVGIDTSTIFASCSSPPRHAHTTRCPISNVADTAVRVRQGRGKKKTKSNFKAFAFQCTLLRVTIAWVSASATELLMLTLTARRAALAVVPTVINGGQTEPQLASVHCLTKPLNVLVCPTHDDNFVIAPHADNHATKHGHRPLSSVSSEMHASSCAEHIFSNSSAMPVHRGNNVEELKSVVVSRDRVAATAVVVVSITVVSGVVSVVVVVRALGVVVVVSITVVSGEAVVVVFSVVVCVAFVCAAAVPNHSAITNNNHSNISSTLIVFEFATQNDKKRHKTTKGLL